MLAYCTATNVGRGMLFYPLHLCQIQKEIEISNSAVKIRQINIDLGSDLAGMIRSSDQFALEVFRLATSTEAADLDSK
jgi:hypothetical protein